MKHRILLIAGLGSVATLIASALGAPPSEASPYGDNLHNAAVSSYADTHSVARGEAESAIADQELVNEAISAVGEDPLRDADVWFSRAHGRQVLTVRTRESKIIQLLDSVPVSPSTDVIVLNDDPASAGAPVLDAKTQTEIREVTPGVQGLHYREEDGVLVVETTDLPAAGMSERIEHSLGVSEVAVVQVEPAGDRLTIRGGVALGGCTAGFTALYSSYVGYFSAAHCGSSQVTYATTNGSGSSITGTRRTYTHNANGDIAFFSIPSGHVIENSFYGGSSSTATVRSYESSVAVGTTICSRGKTSGWRCAAVMSIDYAPTWADACNGVACNPAFVQVNVGTSGGDSGGRGTTSPTHSESTRAGLSTSPSTPSSSTSRPGRRSTDRRM